MDGNLAVTKNNWFKTFILVFSACGLAFFLFSFCIRYVGTNLQGQFVGELKPRLNVNRKTEQKTSST